MVINRSSVLSLLACLLLVVEAPVRAGSPKEQGVKMGVTVTLAASLAACRGVKGDGYDWLDYYLEKLRADRRAIASFMTLPDKIVSRRVQEIVDFFGSCNAMLTYEEQNGLKAFNDVIVPKLSRRVCESAGGC